MAAFTEYRKGDKIYYIHDDVKNESYFLEDAPGEYTAAKSRGEVIEKEMKTTDYYLNPKNLKRSKLKNKIKERDLNLIELNEYIRLMEK